MNFEEWTGISEIADRQMEPLRNALEHMLDASPLVPRLNVAQFFPPHTLPRIGEVIGTQFKDQVADMMKSLELVRTFDRELMPRVEPLDVPAFVDRKTRLAELHDQLHAEADEAARRAAEEDDRPMPGQYL